MQKQMSKIFIEVRSISCAIYLVSSTSLILTMNLKCYLCGSSFGDLKIITNHFKEKHFIKDNTCNLKCVVNHKNFICKKEFKTFKGLQKHVKECLKKQVAITNQKHDVNNIVQVFRIK